MSRVKKILPALGLVLVIAFGTVAVGLAQDTQASSVGNSFQLRGVWKSGAVQMDRYTLSVGMDSETGDLSNYSSPEPEVHRVIYFDDLQTLRLYVCNRMHGSKVPPHLLDLVLLI